MRQPDRIYEDLSLVRRRARAVFAATAVACVLILAYFWKVQIFDYRKYDALARANRIRARSLPAARGVILDRNDVILADNTAGFRVSLVAESVGDLDDLCGRLGGLLETPPETLKDRVVKAAGQPLIVVEDSLSVAEVARLESRKLEFPEIVIEAEPRRSYPFGTLAAHALGYLQEVTAEELAAGGSKPRTWGDMVGRVGIERRYDEDLMGDSGVVYEIVDSRGRSRGEASRVPSRQGRDVRLALDYDLQKAGEEFLAGREGAIAVLDVRTGGVLALASFPTFDPNKFISRFTPSEWQDLVNDPAFPLENRAIRGLYPPGSLFKIVMALAGLETGFVTDRTTVYCGGSTEIYGARRACWFEPGHGGLDLPSAIQYSCNIFFYDLGRRMGIEPIARYADLAGLGRPTGIDIPGEKEGLVPSPEWKMRTARTAWFPGETISVAIGQGPLLVTPLQMANLAAFVARRGSPVRPRLLTDDRGGVVPPAAGEAAGPGEPLKPATFEKIIQGMWRSVNAGGTGAGALVKGYDVCGKTGSTQIMSRAQAERLAQRGQEVKTHAWFAGFAPRDEPRIAIAVLVERAGGGGAMAAPIAGTIIDLFRKKYDR